MQRARRRSSSAIGVGRGERLGDELEKRPRLPPTMELHEGGSVSSAAAAEAAAAGGSLAAACGSGGERMARENMSSRLSVWAVVEM